MTRAERLRRIWWRHRLPVWRAKGRAMAAEMAQYTS